MTFETKIALLKVALESGIDQKTKTMGDSSSSSVSSSNKGYFGQLADTTKNLYNASTSGAGGTVARAGMRSVGGLLQAMPTSGAALRAVGHGLQAASNIPNMISAGKNAIGAGLSAVGNTSPIKRDITVPGINSSTPNLMK